MMSEDRDGRALQRRHEDSGAVAVIVAALVIVLFGMAALGVDIAQQMRDRQDLRDTMDTAAHAGAYELPGNGAGAMPRGPPGIEGDAMAATVLPWPTS